MMALTADRLIRGINTTPAIAEVWVAPLELAMVEFDIDTLQRRAAFLAQVAHESMSLKLNHELWGPTLTQVRYERDMFASWPRTPQEAVLPAFDTNRLAYRLGNSQPGDGRKYAGQGPIQITGRGNMILVGTALGLDLLTTPSLLAAPSAGSRSAAWFFQTHGCNELADAGDLISIRHRINGGDNGLVETINFNRTLLKVLP